MDNFWLNRRNESEEILNGDEFNGLLSSGSWRGVKLATCKADRVFDPENGYRWRVTYRFEAKV